MLCGVFGNIGSGKTLLLVFFLKYLNYHNKYANFTAKVKGVKPITLSELLAMNFSLNEKTLVCLDEAYIELDARRSLKKKNIDISHLIFQSRKRNVDIIYASQLRSSVDLRLRDLTQINILALGKNNKNSFVYYIYEFDQFFVIPSDIAEMLFNLYDTYEIVEPLK